MSTSPIQRSERPSAHVRQLFLGLDPLLLLAAAGLVVCSFLTLRNLPASIYGSEAHKQVFYAAGGVVVALLVSRFDYTLLREYRYVFYGLAIVLNLVVFAFPAPPGAGAQRWIPFPGFSFQSSEFGKILIVLSLAAFAVDRSRRLSEHRTMARLILLALIPAMIVMKQPDLGTGLIYVIIAIAVLYFLGTSWKHLGALGALVVVAAVLVVVVAPTFGVHLLKGYQSQRLTTFLNPPAYCNAQKDTTCYQLQQSLIAIGSGQKTGVGAANATQAIGGYLPVASSDFVFAALAETYGFAGAAVLLSLYALLIWRTIRIVTMAKNLYGTLIAGSILAMFMFQTFLNIGMTLGIMPVTGVPLPLVSYGGSSVLVTFLAIGLLESIHVQARATSAGKAKVLIV